MNLPQKRATNIKDNEILTLVMLGHRRKKLKTQILTANHMGKKTIAERSLTVTEIFIKSPVPGKDGQTGERNKEKGLRQ